MRNILTTFLASCLLLLLPSISAGQVIGGPATYPPGGIWRVNLTETADKSGTFQNLECHLDIARLPGPMMYGAQEVLGWVQFQNDPNLAYNIYNTQRSIGINTDVELTDVLTIPVNPPGQNPDKSYTPIIGELSAAARPMPSDPNSAFLTVKILVPTGYGVSASPSVWNNPADKRQYTVKVSTDPTVVSSTDATYPKTITLKLSGIYNSLKSAGVGLIFKLQKSL